MESRRGLRLLITASTWLQLLMLYCVRTNPRRLTAMAKLLGLSPDEGRTFLVALIALHDIGKFWLPAVSSG